MESEYFINHKGYLVNKKTLQYQHREVLNLKDKNLQVHHLDGNKLNNNINNLMVVTKREHQFIHKKNKKTEDILKFISSQLIELNNYIINKGGM